MNVCNNATAVYLLIILINNDSSTENLTGLKQSTDIVLFIYFFLQEKINILGSRTFSLTYNKIVFHYF